MSYQFGQRNQFTTVYFNIDFERKEKAKEKGFQWDGTELCWYKTLDLSDLQPNEFTPFKPNKQLNNPKVYKFVNDLWIQFGWEQVKNKKSIY